MPYILRTDLNIRHKSQDIELETCWIEIIDPTKNIILGVVYQHPKQKRQTFSQLSKTNFKQGCRRK